MKTSIKLEDGFVTKTLGFKLKVTKDCLYLVSTKSIVVNLAIGERVFRYIYLKKGYSAIYVIGADTMRVFDRNCKLRYSFEAVYGNKTETPTIKWTFYRKKDPYIMGVFLYRDTEGSGYIDHLVVHTEDNSKFRSTRSFEWHPVPVKSNEENNLVRFMTCCRTLGYQVVTIREDESSRTSLDLQDSIAAPSLQITRSRSGIYVLKHVKESSCLTGGQERVLLDLANKVLDTWQLVANTTKESMKVLDAFELDIY